MSQGPTQDDLQRAKDAETRLTAELVAEVDEVLKIYKRHVPFWAERMAYLAERRHEAKIAVALIKDALEKTE